MIGELRHRILLQQAVRVPDGGGGFTQEWQPLAAAPEVYAAIAPLAGGEQLRAYKLEPAATHRIVIRHRTDVAAGMRIVQDSVIYRIIFAAAPSQGQGQAAYLEILAEALP